MQSETASEHLSAIFQQLAADPHYPEFSTILAGFGLAIKEIESVDFESKVLVALKAGFSDLYDICEETGLSEIVVKFHLGKLVRERKISKRLNYSLHTFEYYLA